MPNTLTELRDTYAGPWPRALISVASVVIGGHLIAHVFFDAPLWSVRGLLGPSLVGLGVVGLAFWLKRRYPGK
ncbi:MAG: hypothetical protein CVV05_01605 [Gammaproteobacteria bacterium HGW-Gammaproteobacteria-1]|jgi:hypothetical protein|nr:MAG: hypothetical protein CVV05_01605 [Gammaproteobacteria bacterium HGW-Gammaproteobacteria-1]